MEPKCSLPHLQGPATGPYPVPEEDSSRQSCEIFLNIVSIYGEELLERRPNPSWRTTSSRLS